MKTGLAALKAGLDAKTALLNGGTAEVWSGAVPATPAAAPAGTKLGTCGLGNPACGAAANSGNNALATSNAITDDADADATGAATFVILKTAGGVAQYILDVASGEVTLNNINIQIHGRVRITGCSVSDVM